MGYPLIDIVRLEPIRPVSYSLLCILGPVCRMPFGDSAHRIQGGTCWTHGRILESLIKCYFAAFI